MLQFYNYQIDETKGSEKESVRLVDAVEMVVHGLDLAGDPLVPAGRAFELLTEAEPQVHLGAIEHNDSSTRAVHAHHGRLRHGIQRA